MVNALLPCSFQVKRILDYRSDQTGILPRHYDRNKSTKEHVAQVATAVSIPELKPILKKFIKGKIVIGYNVQSDLQLIDGLTHPKSDVRDVSHFGPYMNTIVTARPMSLHTSQDKQQIVHYEPRPLSSLIETYSPGIGASNEMSSKNIYGLLFNEAVGCLDLYKRVRAEWEDELCRLSRHRYKLPSISAKPTELKVPSSLPVTHHEMTIPVHGIARMEQYYQDLSLPMMTSTQLPADVLPKNRHQSLPQSTYQQPWSYIDRSVYTKLYEDRRYHQNNPTFSDQQRWHHDQVSSGSLEPPYAIPTSRYQRQISNLRPTPSASTSQEPPPSQRAVYGRTEYGATAAARSWETHRHSDAIYLHGTDRLSSSVERLDTNERMRWPNHHEDIPTLRGTGMELQEDTWRAAPSFPCPNNTDSAVDHPLSMLRTSNMTQEKPLHSNMDSTDYRVNFDAVADRDDRLLPTLPSNTSWSPLLTDSLSLLSIFNGNGTTSSSDRTIPIAPVVPLTHSGTTTLTDPTLLSCGDDTNEGGMFQWDDLLSSINDITQQQQSQQQQ
jgi:hypothetical protein